MSVHDLLPALMPADRFGLLCLYVMALTGTPGPANMALVALSGTHGIARTVPFFLGTLAGFAMTYWLAALGLLALVAGLPLVWGALKIACIAYILYLAWLVATAGPATPDVTSARAAPGFLRGFWIHPLNPKAYAMQVAAISQFTVPDRYGADALVIWLTFFLLGGAMNFCWMIGGRLLTRFMRMPRLFRAINVTLAILMVASTLASLVSA
ncbi:threonine/homoserine/homoserine lactone efflux protein [Breoghania corrubedonensis]|uniref:Threonine/homoserine/homoserine lactone efflux protein n=1 Tax=Breoghania corrubedonensis TaxID=665038 RepID=A0A2T5VC33_9HYPH|nr:LysE family translocator [Breoghania corrubedonensis]PTW61310.1 threonine/homoserine/homoserine lactone efflux protein [Breoghania corrubedonensis]